MIRMLRLDEYHLLVDAEEYEEELKLAMPYLKPLTDKNSRSEISHELVMSALHKPGKLPAMVDNMDKSNEKYFKSGLDPIQTKGSFYNINLAEERKMSIF